MLRYRLPEFRWNLGRWSIRVLGIAWVFPFVFIAVQMDRIASDTTFQKAAHHKVRWLTERVGQPQRVRHFSENYDVWFYDRGHFQVEVAVDRSGVVQAVRYVHHP